MAQSKSTPGPWNLRTVAHAKSNIFSGWVESKDHPLAICKVYGGVSSNGPQYRSDEELLANAKLIAAAPELLEALQNVKILFAGREHWPEVIQALNAIKKATE